MSRIVPKLNLNKTPQLVDNNSLIMAKNIRLLEDGTIGPDTSLEEIGRNDSEDTEYIAHIVGLNNKVYFFKKDTTDNKVKIFEYDEIANTSTLVNCGWHYSGGQITGCVSVNGTGECILTICEYNCPNNILVPIKHINLSKCSEDDNENIYTQSPDIPISNLKLSGRYVKNIPAGVYQFFIRYKIRENFYTSWFPCSKELFAGSIKTTDTLQGSIRHADLKEDSDKSFIFTIEHLFPEYCNNFEQYQLGFIISHDGGVFARSWRHFNITESSTDTIYFEYNQDDIEDINIDDLLKVNYEVFNVKNIAQHKNQLYISNYIETDFNEDLNSFAKEVNVELRLADITSDNNNYFDNLPLHQINNSNIYNKAGTKEIKETFRDSHYCDSSFNYTIVRQNPISETDEKDHISKVYIKDGENTHYIYGNSDDDANIEINTENPEILINKIIDAIRANIYGITINGIYKYEVTSTNIINISDFYIEYITYKKNNNKLTPYKNTLQVNVKLKSSVITAEQTHKEYNTLLPFTKYDFYIHYVKQNGTVTNGYYICTKEIKRYCKGYKELSSAPSGVTEFEDINRTKIKDLSYYEVRGYKPYGRSGQHPAYIYYEFEDDSGESTEESTEGSFTSNEIIYPYFSGISCPNGYVGCFISICKYGNNVAQGFNHSSFVESNIRTHKLDCLELDTLLYNTQSNIIIKNSQGAELTTSAKYYSSATVDPKKYLGCSGHIEFTNSNNNSKKYWIIIESIGKPYNKTLQQLTPYIKLDSTDTVIFDDYINVNSPGYLCSVCKLNRNNYYISGNDIYTKDMNDPAILHEVKRKVVYTPSNINYIFSNFNLNYVSLTSDLTPVIRSYEEPDSENDTTYKKQFITLVNSLTASFSLELKSMFRDYTRKLYYEYTKNRITEFNNTIRVSSLDVDETYRYIYRFEATDYYNVPTHRGIITNVIAIGNTIYVHCEHSLFKFTDKQTLGTEDEQVVLQENDIFNSGIAEVFDAQFGYAGLKNKEESLVTFNYYVFYDSVARTIYAFGGENQLAKISDPIKKLINWLNPSNIRFIGDELHNRFFVNLVNEDDKTNVCLSFNFTNNAFISVHDINFTKGFHSRNNSYFINESNGSWSINKVVDTIGDKYVIYGKCYKPSEIKITDYDTIIDESEEIETTSINACVDVLINTEYEVIKQLDYINWICSEIQGYENNDNRIAEETLKKYPAHKIRIYSDNTSTDLIDLYNLDDKGNVKTSNDITIRNKGSWECPRFNCGVWSMNYFRDTLQVSDEPSLIYGKYFVVRFIFSNKNFKLENLKLKMNDYGKTK